MDLARTTSVGRLCGRAATLLAKCFAILLLMVGPAHATMQQIVLEHLPTAYSQAYDGIESGKLILRGQVDKTVASLADLDRDDGVPVGAEFGAIAPVATPAEPIAFRAQALSNPLDSLALKRAPPIDTTL